MTQKTASGSSLQGHGTAPDLDAIQAKNGKPLPTIAILLIGEGKEATGAMYEEITLLCDPDEVSLEIWHRWTTRIQPNDGSKTNFVMTEASDLKEEIEAAIKHWNSQNDIKAVFIYSDELPERLQGTLNLASYIKTIDADKNGHHKNCDMPAPITQVVTTLRERFAPKAPATTTA